MSCWQALERSFQRVCRQVSTRPSPMGIPAQNCSASLRHAESARAVNEAVASAAAKSAISDARGLVLDMGVPPSSEPVWPRGILSVEVDQQREGSHWSEIHQGSNRRAPFRQYK